MNIEDLETIKEKSKYINNEIFAEPEPEPLELLKAYIKQF